MAFALVGIGLENDHLLIGSYWVAIACDGYHQVRLCSKPLVLKWLVQLAKWRFLHVVVDDIDRRTNKQSLSPRHWTQSPRYLQVFFLWKTKRLSRMSEEWPQSGIDRSSHATRRPIRVQWIKCWAHLLTPERPVKIIYHVHLLWI